MHIRIHTNTRACADTNTFTQIRARAQIQTHLHKYSRVRTHAHTYSQFIFVGMVYSEVNKGYEKYIFNLFGITKFLQCCNPILGWLHFPGSRLPVTATTCETLGKNCKTIVFSCRGNSYMWGFLSACWSGEFILYIRFWNVLEN